MLEPPSERFLKRTGNDISQCLRPLNLTISTSFHLFYYFLRIHLEDYPLKLPVIIEKKKSDLGYHQGDTIPSHQVNTFTLNGLPAPPMPFAGHSIQVACRQIHKRLRVSLVELQTCWDSIPFVVPLKY